MGCSKTQLKAKGKQKNQEGSASIKAKIGFNSNLTKVQYANNHG